MYTSVNVLARISARVKPWTLLVQLRLCGRTPLFIRLVASMHVCVRARGS